MFRYISLRFSRGILSLFFWPPSLGNGTSFSFLGVSEINCNDFRRVWPKYKKKHRERDGEKKRYIRAIFHQRVRMQFHWVHRKLTAEHLFLSSSIRTAQTCTDTLAYRLASPYEDLRCGISFRRAKAIKCARFQCECMIFIATDVITLCDALM